MKLGNLGFDPVTAAAGASTAIKAVSSIFGGDDTNYAKTFSKQVGTGKMFLQSEADAYRARASQYGLDAVQLAKTEYAMGRALTPQELAALSGQGGYMPASAAAPAPYSQAVASTPYGQALAQQSQSASAPGANWLPLGIAALIGWKLFL